MIKIGIVGLSGRAEGFFAAYGCSDEWMRKLTFARGVQQTVLPAHLKVNNQEIDFELRVTQHHDQQGVFAFTTNCDGYVILVESANYTKEKLDVLVANILTFEKKTNEEVPMHIVLVDGNNNGAVQQYAESKSIPFSHIHIVASIIFPGAQLPPDPTVAVHNTLSSVVGRVLPNLGTDRVLKAPPSNK